MEGARIIRVEARRPDLRRPLPRDFVKRLEGQTVTGIGRRAKYLTADLASGDVLLMHLGMSGSFRVSHEPPPRPSRARRGGKGGRSVDREHPAGSNMRARRRSLMTTFCSISSPGPPRR